MSSLHINENTEIGNTGITLKQLISKLNDKAESSQITSINNSISTINSNYNSLKSIVDKLNIYRYYYGGEVSVSNCNNMQHNGTYFWALEFSNRPPEPYGVILVLNSTGIAHNNKDNWCMQLAFSTGHKIYYRQKINAGGWTGWKTVV